jgi:hypothetical protein
MSSPKIKKEKNTIQAYSKHPPPPTNRQTIDWNLKGFKFKKQASLAKQDICHGTP